MYGRILALHYSFFLCESYISVLFVCFACACLLCVLSVLCLFCCCVFFCVFGVFFVFVVVLNLLLILRKETITKRKHILRTVVSWHYNIMPIICILRYNMIRLFGWFVLVVFLWTDNLKQAHYNSWICNKHNTRLDLYWHYAIFLMSILHSSLIRCFACACLLCARWVFWCCLFFVFFLCVFGVSLFLLF